MSIVELCNLQNKPHLILPNFELSKKIKPDETYVLNRQNINKLKLINEHNSILSQPGKDGFGRKILRLSHSIPTFTNDTNIDFSRNYIKSIPNKILPRNTISLNISHNIMFTLDNINENLPNLRELNCSHNGIKKLPSLPNNLTNLKSNNNNLQSLPELPNTLQKLVINDNNIKNIPNSILQCNQLNDLNYENNTNITVSEEILDFIEQIFERRRVIEERNELMNNNIVNNNIVYKKIKRTVVDNSQNVHDSKIRQEVSDAIIKLIKNDKCNISPEFALKEFGEVIGYTEEDIDIQHYDCFGKEKKNNKKVSDIKWSVDYSKDPEEDYNFIKKLYNISHSCSISKITIKKLFTYFWNRVRDSDNKDEILKTFITEDIPEMKIVCFVGRISRIINCLSGYFDDINVGISIKQQIDMKINLTLKKFDRYKNETLKFNILCYYHLIELLQEIKIENEIIQKWVYPFIEEIEENIDNPHSNFIIKNLPEDIRNKFTSDLENGIFET